MLQNSTVLRGTVVLFGWRGCPLCTIRMQVACGLPLCASSMQTVAGCVHDSTVYVAVDTSDTLVALFGPPGLESRVR